MPELTPVRGIITTPITLSGVGQVSYGVTVGSTGATERWCYNPTPVSPGGGIYDVTTGGVWTRVTDLDFSGGAGDFANMPWFHVREGNERIAGSEWWYSGPQVPTENVTNITFTKRSHGDAWVAGRGMDTFNNEMRLIERTGVAGSWASPNLDLDMDGIVIGVTGGESGSSFIEGLKVIYDGAAALTVEAGAAFAPGAGSMDMDETSKTGLVLTANTWYYLYEFSNSGIGDWEYSTQRPASTYMGAARVKGGPDNTDPDVTPDETRRFIRSIRCSGSANVMRNFYADYANWVWWQEDTTATPYRVLNAGTVGNTWTAVSCSAVVPATARRVFLRVSVPGGQIVSLGNSGTTSITEVNNAMTGVFLPFTLNSSQQFYYKHAGGAPGTGTNIDVIGFYEPV